jgi:hypothetical protein
MSARANRLKRYALAGHHSKKKNFWAEESRQARCRADEGELTDSMPVRILCWTLNAVFPEPGWNMDHR